jgi:protein TonB
MLLNLTEIIFENRNKLYGAYSLRKNYLYALLIGFACNLPLLLFGVFWIKYEQEESKPIPKESFVEKEIMLQVNEDVQLADIEDLPVLVENNTNFVPTTSTKNEPEPTENEAEKNENPEIKVSENPQNEEAKKDEPQNKETKKDTINTQTPSTSEKPSVVYSPDVWSIYVKENLRYPPQALRERKECNVFVAVIIREDGSLELDKERALYGCEEYFNEEVKRLIANAPRFIPATDANGKPKNRINLKISFKLP